MFNEIKQKIKSRHSENIYQIPYLYIGLTIKTTTIQDTQFTYRHYEIFLGNSRHRSDISFVKRLTGENPNNIAKIEDKMYVRNQLPNPVITETNTQITYIIRNKLEDIIKNKLKYMSFPDRLKYSIINHFKQELSLKELNKITNRLNTKNKYKAYYKEKKRDKKMEKYDKVARIEEEKNQNMLNREFGK